MSGTRSSSLARRGDLLAGCALAAALIASVQSTPARADAFAANPTTVAGTVTYNRAVAGADTITVETPSAIIRWDLPPSPTNPYTFLPAGSTATFQNGPVNPNFVVLNRINSNNVMRFDGTVRSQLIDGAGTTVPGGTVLFAAPGGIIVGPTALFDIGSLVLTSLNVVDDGAGNFTTADGGFLLNGGDKAPNASIVVSNGARIQATEEGSFVALIAPVINQGGSIRVNGSTAMIAGEEVEFLVNRGLFDIIVNVGTDNATPITHGGTTGGPGQTGADGDNHAIYAVAVPQAQAVQILLNGGSMGFDPVAGVVNGEIVLSAGFDVTGGRPSGPPLGAEGADIIITGGAFGSNVTGLASRDADVSVSGKAFNFAGSLNLNAHNLARVQAVGAVLGIGGDLTLRAENETTGAAGRVVLEAGTGGTINVGGEAFLSANALGTAAAGTGGEGRGGNIEVRAIGSGPGATGVQRGAINIAKGLTASAIGIGGGGDVGGTGRGGQILIEGRFGDVRIGGDALLAANGMGGVGRTATGDGRGGAAALTVNEGSITVGGDLTLDGSGFAGRPEGVLGAVLGQAFGGVARIDGTASTVPSTIRAGSIALHADAGSLDLNRGMAGPAQGGIAAIALASGMTLTTTTDVEVTALGVGGAGLDNPAGPGGAGFNGRGGDVLLNFAIGSNATIRNLVLDNSGFGGNGGAGLTGGRGGDGTGGTLAQFATGASPTVASLTLRSNGFGGAGGAGLEDAAGNPGNGGDGGRGTGGRVDLVATQGANLVLAATLFDAQAFGGQGGAGSTGAGPGGDGGAGGSADGGAATVRASVDGRVTFTDPAGIVVSALGQGGPGGNGGGAAGAMAPGDGGAGGFGLGGTAVVDVAGGSITTPITDLRSLGQGGAGGKPGVNGALAGAPGAPGNGQGDQVSIAINDSSVFSGSLPGSASLGTTILVSNGINGAGATTIDDFAGQISVGDSTVNGAGLTMTSLTVTAVGEQFRSPVFSFQDNSNATVGQPHPQVRVTGDVSINVSGDVTFTAFGAGGLSVGGRLTVITPRVLNMTNHNPGFGDGTAFDAAAIGLTAGLCVCADFAGLSASSTDVVIRSPDVRLNRIDANRDISVFDAASIALGSTISGRDTTLTSTGIIQILNATVGDDFSANAGTTFTVSGTINAPGGGPNSEVGSIPTPPFSGTGNIVITSGGTLNLANANAAGRIQLTSTAGDVRSSGLLDAGTSFAATGATVDLEDVDAGSTVTLTATNDIDADGVTAVGAITATAGRHVTLAGAASTTGAVAVTATGGAATLNRMRAGTDLTVQGTRISLTDAIVARDIILNSTTDITVGSAQAGDDFSANAGGAFTGTTVNATGAGADSEVGAGALGGTGNVDIISAGHLRLDNGNAAALILLRSTNGDVRTAGIITAGTRFDGSGLGFTMDAGARITAPVILATARTGAAILRDLVGGAVTVGAPGGTATFLGAVTGTAIDVTSRGIDLTATGSLGNGATNTVTLRAPDSPAQIVLGGVAEGPGYTLTDAEADRITARTLTIEGARAVGAPAGDPHILVRDLSIAAARVTTLSITSAGIIQVEGALEMTGAADANALNLRADQRIQVVNPAGSIRLRDGAGNPIGTLTLTSPAFWSVTQPLLDQLRADPSFAGRNDALLTNPGAVAPRGYVEAGDVTFRIRDTLFVQNSGTATEFAGVTVLQNTLTLAPTGPALEVQAFGRRFNPDGSFVTGETFFREIALDRTGGTFAGTAQFNRCIINTGVCAAPGPVPGGPGGPAGGGAPPFGSDIVEGPVEGWLGASALSPAQNALVDASFAADPLIEEPVTSGSESVLWECDRDEDGDCDADDRDE